MPAGGVYDAVDVDVDVDVSGLFFRITMACCARLDMVIPSSASDVDDMAWVSCSVAGSWIRCVCASRCVCNSGCNNVVGRRVMLPRVDALMLGSVVPLDERGRRNCA